jgi:amphi-Trp domain-containing protein
MRNKNITLSTRLTRADVAGIVEALVEGLKEGTLKVQKSDMDYTLEAPRVVDLEIEAGEIDERTVFRLEISWRTNPPEIPDTDGLDRSRAAAAEKTAARKTAPKSADKPKTAAGKKKKA